MVAPAKKKIAGSSPRSGRQSNVDADLTRSRMIAAAQRIFAQKGYGASSLRDIAAESGIAHGLIRHHFGSKELLWQAAVDDAVGHYEAALASVFDETVPANPSEPPVETARQALRAFLNVAANNPDLVRIILHEGVAGGQQLDYVMSCFAPLGEKMEPLLRQVQAAGRLRQFNNDTIFLFILTAGAAPLALHALSAWLLRTRKLGKTDQHEHIERLLVTLLGEVNRPGD
jgi:TetR/AcrR family transcriptional regulator